jgi:hypothetical protein
MVWGGWLQWIPWSHLLEGGNLDAFAKIAHGRCVRTRKQATKPGRQVHYLDTPHYHMECPQINFFDCKMKE